MQIQTPQRPSPDQPGANPPPREFDATPRAPDPAWRMALGADDAHIPQVERVALQQRRSRNLKQEKFARVLGWLGIALGAAALLAPRQTGRAIGVRDNTLMLRALGIREIVSGVGILTQQRPVRWMWSRVAGDALDLALLGTAMTSAASHRGRVGIATAAVAGIAALDLVSAAQLARLPRASATRPPHDGSVKVHHRLAVTRTPDECYRYWRQLENLPRFMRHLESVTVAADNRSHWIAKGLAGTRIEWDAEITEDRPAQLIAWRSLEGSEVDNAGRVMFIPEGHGGTVVDVEFRYRPPGGPTAAIVAELFGEEPQQQVREGLRRFKQMLEAGEIPTTEGQPAGPRSVLFRTLRHWTS